VNGTGSGSCAVGDLGIGGVLSIGSATSLVVKLRWLIDRLFFSWH
jgi:hypothetical protein